MTGILLILAALAITVALAVVLVSVVGAALRSRGERAAAPAPEKPAGPGKPGKPALVPWLVVSGILLLVLTAIGAASLEGCRALGRYSDRQRCENECEGSLQGLATRLAAYWDQRKELPPPGAVSMTAACPLGNQFRYVGHRDVRFGGTRVLAIECEPHEDGSRRAVVADQRFLDAKKTEKDYQGGNSYYYGYGTGSPHGCFRTLKVSSGDYETLRRAVEGE